MNQKQLKVGGGVTEDHLKQHARLYEPGVLQPETHHRLVQNLPEIIRTSHVPEVYISHSMGDYCDEDEIEWVADFYKHAKAGVFGLLYVGTESTHRRMSAVCGALLRNFIDARVLTAQEIIDGCKERKPPDATVAAVPNFHRSKTSSGDIASWDIQHLYRWLFERQAAQHQTIIFTQSIQGLKADYGSGIYELVADTFTQITE